MDEKTFEDIICRYPELIENDLLFKGRQVAVRGKRVDVLFEDRHGQLLIVEIKKGTVLREHVGQLLDYEGNYVSEDNPNVRVMLVGNRVPENLRRSLDHHGFEWKELTIRTLVDFLGTKEDSETLRSLVSEESLVRDIQKKPERRPTSVDHQVSPPVSDRILSRIEIPQKFYEEMKKYNALIKKETNTIFRQNNMLLNGAEIYFTLSGYEWRGNEVNKDAIVYFSRASNNLVVIPRIVVDTYIFDPLFQKTLKGYYLADKYKHFAIDDKDRINLKFLTRYDRLLVILKALSKYDVDPIPLISLPSVYWLEIDLEKIDSESKLVNEIRRICQELSSGKGIMRIQDH